MKKSSRSFYFPQTIVLLLILFFIFLVSLSQTNSSYFSVVNRQELVNFAQEKSPTPTSKPERAAPPEKLFDNPEPVLTARAVLVMDFASQSVLYQKNEDLPLWPASTTKMMTALVALDEYDVSEVVTVVRPEANGRIMYLLEGEQITVENLLYGMLVHSANDAAYALADHYSQGREGFVSKMNQKAKELTLVNSHFVDPAGFDDDKQYSTASDLAALTMKALENKLIAKIISTPSITISDVNYVTFHRLTNVNELLGRVPGVAGGKTGWTENAKENLINLTKRNGNEILTVVLGSEDRFGETQQIVEWTFSNFTWPSQSITGQLPEQRP